MNIRKKQRSYNAYRDTFCGLQNRMVYLESPVPVPAESRAEAKITWTRPDEAPRIASYSLLPIFTKFLEAAGVEVDERDISLAGRIIAAFSDKLDPEQRREDDLAYLGKLVEEPEANIVKLPNISASVVQIKAAIAELQGKGYNIPDYPDNPQTDEEKAVFARYQKVLGSVVNPVLRQGNADRRLPESVKTYAQAHPHEMGEWLPDSQAHVSTMSEGDFRANEISKTVEVPTTAKIVFVSPDGGEVVLNEGVSLDAGEIVDSTFMSKRALEEFLETQMQEAKEQGILLSLHLKATMMKVSDPIIFGHAIKVFFKDVIASHRETFEALDVNFNNGLADLYAKIEGHPQATQIKADMEAAFEQMADIAMVDSNNGITNLHRPNDVIVDASMASTIRNGGKMWNKNGEPRDTKCVLPDSTYAALYEEIIRNCQENGPFDPQTMGTVQNVGLMAMKAEEYGSHGTTHEIRENGMVRITDADGNVIQEQAVEEGDIWRMTRVKDAAIRDWVKLAITRARATQEKGFKTIFWLDDDRSHHVELRKKVEEYLAEHDTADLDIEILSVREAAKVTTERARQGLNTIAVTGNVLRDWITDVYPILETGKSSSMLSGVPLMAGGLVCETGAGGSAPKLVEQFIRECFLRWDSMGELLAMVPALEKLAEQNGNAKAQVLASTLDQANEKLLSEQKTPGRKVGELDNRGSHFYLALYWAEALSQQTEDAELAAIFSNVYAQLSSGEMEITQQLADAQGQEVNLDGYYLPNDDIVEALMRPSETFNHIINSIVGAA